MKNIPIITLVVVIIIGAVTIFSTFYGIDQSSKSSQEISDTVEKGNADLLEEIRESNKNDAALIEKSFSDFQPELEYRIFGTGDNIHKPYSIRAEIINKGNELTFVKNLWTITGEICNPDGTSRDFNYDYSIRDELILNKDQKGSVDFPIPLDFFEKFPDKTAFLLKLELEMNPYLPSSGPIETREFDEMAFIQFDFNKERNNNWLVKNVFRELNCVEEPSIWGHVTLNTTSWDFGEYGQWWKFSEEEYLSAKIVHLD